MFGSEPLSCAARFFSFAKFGIGERDGESVNPLLRAAGKRRDRRGVQAAAEKHADRNIGDEMATNGVFQECADAQRRRGWNSALRPPGLLHLFRNVPV